MMNEGSGEGRQADEGAMAGLDPKIEEMIGRSLKAHYDDIVKAPMPDRFLVLLAQLEAREQAAPAGTGLGRAGVSDTDVADSAKESS